MQTLINMIQRSLYQSILPPVKWTDIQCSLVGKVIHANIVIITPSQVQLPSQLPSLVRELVPSSWMMCSVMAQKPNL